MEYGLIGERLGHSFSKALHEKLADYTYDLTELRPEELVGFLRERKFRAINVTIPYKEAVIPQLDEISEEAREIGAVNTVVNRDGRLYGHNTDCEGLAALLRRNAMELAGRKVLILGSGGTSKTALYVAKRLGASCAYRVSRGGRDGCITYEEAYAAHADAQVLINATPSGMYPDLEGQPVDLRRFPRLEAVCDVIYNPLRTQLALQARELGIPACGGLYMLVGQAVGAIEKFIGKRPSDEAAERVFRELLRERENIVLIGMPGSGKSTVGARLAARLGRELVEMDEIISARDGREITDIFSQDGEAAFRDQESALAAELAGRTGCVISTGGGAVLRPENVRHFRRNGRVFFINRPLGDIRPTASRPLALDRAALQKRFDERYDIYTNAADAEIPVTGDPDAVAQKIWEAFQQ